MPLVIDGNEGVAVRLSFKRGACEHLKKASLTGPRQKGTKYEVRLGKIVIELPILLKRVFELRSSPRGPVTAGIPPCSQAARGVSPPSTPPLDVDRYCMQLRHDIS